LRLPFERLLALRIVVFPTRDIVAYHHFLAMYAGAPYLNNYAYAADSTVSAPAEMYAGFSRHAAVRGVDVRSASVFSAGDRKRGAEGGGDSAADAKRAKPGAAPDWDAANPWGGYPYAYCDPAAAAYYGYAAYAPSNWYFYGQQDAPGQALQPPAPAPDDWQWQHSAGPGVGEFATRYAGTGGGSCWVEV